MQVVVDGWHEVREKNPFPRADKTHTNDEALLGQKPPDQCHLSVV